MSAISVREAESLPHCTSNHYVTKKFHRFTFNFTCDDGRCRYLNYKSHVQKWHQITYLPDVYTLGEEFKHWSTSCIELCLPYPSRQTFSRMFLVSTSYQASSFIILCTKAINTLCGTFPWKRISAPACLAHPVLLSGGFLCESTACILMITRGRWFLNAVASSETSDHQKWWLLFYESFCPS